MNCHSHGRRPLSASLSLAAGALVAGVLSACSPTYVLRAGWEEAKILHSRRPIHDVVHDTTAPRELRDKLRLVQDARAFAGGTLGLDPGNSFTSYAEVDRDTLLLVVSAAPPYELRWKTWWFPIVGRVPYKGYFNFAAARREAVRLERQGYDTYVRPTTAFSTLGWLPDPLLSTVLRADSVDLVATIIHEITHTTFFPAGQAQFNESLANFVGHRGAIAFFCDALREEGHCATARERWSDTREFGRFFHSIVDPLRELYARDLPDDERARRKREILRRASVRFAREVRPRLRSGSYGDLDPERLNNAWLLARILYYTRLDDFETIYEHAGSLRAAVRAILDAASADDPWSGIDAILPTADSRADSDSPASGERAPAVRAPGVRAPGVRAPRKPGV